MTLRLRILLGYGYLVALLLLAAGSAMLGFFRLSAGIDEVLEENLTSIRASMEMIESLERQDSATLAALVERANGPISDDQDEQFNKALERAEGNVTEVEEPDILQAIGEGFVRYKAARTSLLSSRPERPLVAYDRQVFPLFSAVKTDVIHLLDVNQRAMFRADQRARQSAAQSGVWLGFLVAVALLSLVFLSRALQRDVLSRLEELQRGLKVVAAGDLQRRLLSEGNDELAAISHSVNQLLDGYQKCESRASARHSLERHRLLGLVAAVPEGSLYEEGGAFVAGAGGEPRHAAVARWIAEEGRRQRKATRDEAAERVSGLLELADEVGGEQLQVRSLYAGQRLVGWLAQPAP